MWGQYDCILCVHHNDPHSDPLCVHISVEEEDEDEQPAANWSYSQVNIMFEDDQVIYVDKINLFSDMWDQVEILTNIVNGDRRDSDITLNIWSAKKKQSDMSNGCI